MGIDERQVAIIIEATIERGGIISDRQNWQEADIVWGSPQPIFRQSSRSEHAVESAWQLFPGVDCFLQQFVRSGPASSPAIDGVQFIRLKFRGLQL